MNKLDRAEIAKLRAEVAQAVAFLDEYHRKRIVYHMPNARRLGQIFAQVQKRGRGELDPADLPSPLLFGLWHVFGASMSERPRHELTAAHGLRMAIMGHVVMADCITGSGVLVRGMVYFALLDNEAKARGFTFL